MTINRALFRNLKLSLFISMLLISFIAVSEASAVRWDFTSSTEGWYARGAATVNWSANEGGNIFMYAKGSDTGIVSPSLSLNASSNNLVKFSMSSYCQNSNVQLFFRPSGSPTMINGGIQPATYGPGFYTYSFDMTGNSSWTGTITELRIDIGNSSDSCGSTASPVLVAFDWIEVIKRPNNPPVITGFYLSHSEISNGWNLTGTVSSFEPDNDSWNCTYNVNGGSWQATGTTNGTFPITGLTIGNNVSGANNSIGLRCADYEAYGNWSSPPTVIDYAVPNTAPTSLSPNGTTIPEQANYQFIFGAARDAFGVNAHHYQAIIADNTSYSNPVYNQEVAGSPFSVSSSVLQAGKTYYWKMCGENKLGSQGPCAEASFSIQVPPPQLTSPTSGATVSVGTDITFDWDPSQGAGRYRLKICTDSSMTSCINNGNQFEPPNGQTWYTVPGGNFTVGTTYYWQVGAIAPGDVGGWGNYGPTPAWSFIVNKPLPPALTSPTNGATVSVGRDITFDWDPSQGAGRYRLKICTDSSMTSCINNGNPFEPPNGQTWYTVPGGNFTVGTTYYWQVGAIAPGDVGGWGNYGPTPAWSFTVELSISPSPVFVPLYRLYKSDATNPVNPTRDHFYTTSKSEKDNAVTTYGYTYEGIEAYISDRNFDGSVPMYRLYKADKNSHYYTTNETEKNAKLGEGYVLEGTDGIIGYVYPAVADGLVSMHRMRQTINTPYHYFMCTKKNECEKALTTSAWGFGEDTIIGYVSPDGLRDPLAHNRPQGGYGGADLGSGAYRVDSGLGLAMKGRGPLLAFSHYYNSFSAHQAFMGQGWSHNLESLIDEDTEGNVYVNWGDGTISYFIKTGSTYQDVTGDHDILTLINDGMNYGYDIKRKDQTVYQYRRYSINPLPEVEPDSPSYQRNKILLIYIVDWAGNTLTIEREAAYGSVQNVRDSLGRKLVFNYDTSFKLRKVEELVDDVAKRYVSFAYNTAGLLETFTDARGIVTRYDYDADNLLASITYPEGNTVTVGYEPSTKKVSSVKSGSDPAASITYTPSSNQTKLTDPRGNVCNYTHQDFRMTSQQGQGEPNPASFVYGDPLNPNKPTHIADKEGHTTDFVYDPMGNVTRITNARGKISEFTYNDKNNLTSSKEFHTAGTSVEATVYEYDAANGNKLIKITTPEDRITEIHYNANNQVDWIKDGRGFMSYYAYDSYGNLETVTDAEGNITVYTNDYAGRTTRVVDGDTKKTDYNFDENDNLRSVLDHLNRQVSMDYDDNNNLSLVSWVRSGITSETKYYYNTEDRLRQLTNPLNINSIYTYNQVDRSMTKTDFNGSAITLSSDLNNRIASIAYPDHTVIIGRNKNGSITSVSGPQGNSSFTYNNLNLIETYTDPYGKVVRYDYNDAGKLWKITYPDDPSKVVTYEYYGDGQLKSVEDWNNNKTTYIYDAAGNLKEIQRPNGTKAVYDYDRASRLVGISEYRPDNSVFISYSYVLSDAGDIESVTADEPLAPIISPANVTYTHDKANRLETAGNTSYTYSNNGNRTGRSAPEGSSVYEWDYENKLTKIIAPSQTVRYYYDGMNNRIAKGDGSGITKKYVLDLRGDMSQVLAETDASGNITAYYIYGIGLVSRISNSGTHYYHHNNRGDTIALTDSSGNVTDSYAYDEYGKMLNSQGSTPNPFKFIGQHGVMDEGNNLYFMRARFYDAETGRFLSEDPLGFEGGDWNVYAYVGGNPMMGIDPEGTFLKYLGAATKDFYNIILKGTVESAATYTKMIATKDTMYRACYLMTYGNYCENKMDNATRRGVAYGKDAGKIVAGLLGAPLIPTAYNYGMKYMKSSAGIKLNNGELLNMPIDILSSWSPYPMPTNTLMFNARQKNTWLNETIY